jgi:tetratricopeptide (TPR) repeat protein
MHKRAIWRLSLACWLVASVPQIAFAGPETTGQPMPFEFGPDWRWVPPSERFPPQGRGRDPAEPGPVIPKRPERRPEALGPSETPPSEAALRGEALKQAMAPRPDPAVVRQEKVDALFVRLAAEQDPEAAKRLAETLEIVWLQSGSETADLLMQRASAAMNSGHYQVALALLDKIVVLEPGWVEVWNRRAAVQSQLGDVDAAMADIDRVLKLEPRHFRALTAMGTILEKAGFEQRALEVFRRALAIFPSQPLLQDHIERLEIAVEGRGI